MAYGILTKKGKRSVRSLPFVSGEKEARSPIVSAMNKTRELLRILNTTETNPSRTIQTRRRQKEFAMFAELIGLWEIPY